MINVTDSAFQQLRTIVQEQDDQTKGLRISIEHGGCAGLQYSMGLDHAPPDFIKMGWVLAMNGPNTEQKASTPSHANPTRAPGRGRVSRTAWRPIERGAMAAAACSAGSSGMIWAASIDIAHPGVGDRIRDVGQKKADHQEDCEDQRQGQEQFAIGVQCCAGK